MSQCTWNENDQQTFVYVLSVPDVMSSVTSMTLRLPRGVISSHES